MVLPIVSATRYVAPLREGGSLPGIVEGDDLGTYVCKFRGAGQGLNVLVAEVVVAGLARALGLDTPRLVEIELDEAIARYEADEEVQDLLTASLGSNLGVDFLPGSFGFDTSVEVDDDFAGRLLWLDAFVANVDRSWRNPNLLVWHGRPWLIDHGASLYFHHGWSGGVGSPERFAAQPWDASAHVLARRASTAAAVDAACAAAVTDEVLRAVTSDVPDGWLGLVPGAETLDAVRAAYVAFLTARRDGGRPLAAGRCDVNAYQYVVLRCVPRVDREEFVNVGVVVYCQSAAFLDLAWDVSPERLRALAPGVDVDAVCDGLDFAAGVCRGDERLGDVAGQDLGTRFGFLKAPRSTVLQPGPVHGGRTTDPAATLGVLLDRLVR